MTGRTTAMTILAAPRRGRRALLAHLVGILDVVGQLLAPAPELQPIPIPVRKDVARR